MEHLTTASFDLGPKPRLAYAGGNLDRAAERRADEAFVRARASEATSAFYVVGGEWIVLRKSHAGLSPAFPPQSVPALGEPKETIFLGLQSGAGRFAIGLGADAIERLKTNGEFHVTDLRTIAVQGLVPFTHLPALAEAKSLLHWHARHRFCANCGAPTRTAQAGWRRDCAQCDAQHFPRTDPVAIMLAIDGDRCLLGRQSRFPPGMWSCLAGFAEPGENIEEAVRRETREEAGILCGRVRYFASQPWPYPSSLMIGCHAEALSRDIRVDREELEDARWFSRAEAASLLTRRHPQGLTAPPPMAIAHHLIRDWVENGARVLG